MFKGVQSMKIMNLSLSLCLLIPYFLSIFYFSLSFFPFYLYFSLYLTLPQTLSFSLSIFLSYLSCLLLN